jgi:hypothetical protein
MRLINEQPMDTFPEEGAVFVRIGTNVLSYSEGEIDKVDATFARSLDLLGIYTAWSYTVTTLTEEEQP